MNRKTKPMQTHLVNDSNEENGKQEISTNDYDADEEEQFHHEQQHFVAIEQNIVEWVAVVHEKCPTTYGPK